MTDTEDEAAWRAEFERIGVDQVHDLVWRGFAQEPKRQFGFRWLGEQAAARQAREEATYWFVRWTFAAAVAAMLVGVIGVVATIFHK